MGVNYWADEHKLARGSSIPLNSCLRVRVNKDKN